MNKDTIAHYLQLEAAEKEAVKLLGYSIETGAVPDVYNDGQGRIQVYVEDFKVDISGETYRTSVLIERITDGVSSPVVVQPGEATVNTKNSNT